MKGTIRELLKPESEVELLYIREYTAYLFKHIQLGFDIDIENIQAVEKNLEMIIDQEFGDIYAYRFDYPEPVAKIMDYYGTWELTTNGEALSEVDQLRIKLLCMDRKRN